MSKINLDKYKQLANTEGFVMFGILCIIGILTLPAALLEKLNPLISKFLDESDEDVE